MNSAISQTTLIHAESGPLGYKKPSYSGFREAFKRFENQTPEERRALREARERKKCSQNN